MPIIENPDAIDSPPLPSLYADRSFWGMTITQFFGAFNDNLFKQLILLIAVGLSASQVGEGGVLNRQGLASLAFALPFVLFSTYAGFVADRVSKTKVIVLAKVGEIVVMVLGLLAFYGFGQTGFAGLCAVLFCMGMQSAFFGPAKYGILPEMVRDADLPRANGFFLMTTFLAIIFGMASAGWLSEWLTGSPAEIASDPTSAAHGLWLASILCVVVAVVGTFASMMVRYLPAANPGLKFERSTLAIPADMRAMLANDRLLLVVLTASSIFWLVGGIIQPTVNDFGIQQLGLKQTPTSYMAAAMGVGIALGCCLTGYLSAGRVRFGLAKIGAWGMLACLLLLGMPSAGTEHGHFWGYWGSLPLLVGLGAFAGLFVVPLQVFVQSRPPEDKKGRMIALMNLCSWIGIIISAVLVIVIDLIQTQMDWSKASSFWFVAAIILPIAVFFNPAEQGAAILQDESAEKIS